MNPVLQLNEFFVEGDNEELSHVLLHIIQPSTPEEEKDKGYFFAVCEINNGDKDDIYNLQNLMDKIENEYYESPSEPDKSNLESILEKLNHSHLSLSRPEADLNCAVGTLRGGEIVFSIHGTPQVLLFYKNREGIYQKMDLLESNEDENEEKLFPQIIQGKISPGDYFFIGTPHISNCFTHDRLQKIITVRSPEQSVQHFEKVLSDMKSGYSYGGLVVHSAKQEDEAAAPAKLRTQERTDLSQMEKKTAQTLSPSLISGINARMKSMVARDEEEAGRPAGQPGYPQTEVHSTHLKRHEKSAGLEPQTLTTIFKVIWLVLKYIGLGVYKVFLFIVMIISGLGKGLIMLFMIATNFQNRRKSILESWGNNYRSFKSKFSQMPLLTKILGIAAVVFAVIFIGSLIYMQIGRTHAAKNQEYQNAFQLVRNKTDAAESAMIYSDLDGARRESDEAKNLLTTFTCRPEDESSCKDISNRLESIAIKLRKMETLPLTVIHDWNTASATVDKIFKINNKIVGFASGSPSIYVYDLLTKEGTPVAPSINGLTGYINSAVPKENDYAILLANDYKTLVIFDPQNNSLKKADIGLASDDTQIKSINVYNRRLYALDTGNNQIYRYDSTKSGFGIGKEWLNDASANLHDGTDITIDGDLFVLKTTGEIYKFTQGSKQAFDIQGVDPAISGGDEIWTYTDLANIYILDGKNKRLIILDKQGKLVRQLTAAEFVNPTGAVIEETKNVIYFSDANKIYQMNLK